MSWRRIDIDQYDEDAYTEDEIMAEFEAGLTPQQLEADAQTRTSDVRNLMNKGDLNAALVRSLEDPPYLRHIDQVKLASTQSVVDVLNAYRASDIETVVKGLKGEQRDLTEVAGTGSIVRVMTDKRSVTVA
ncbi:Arp2/3 complex 16 kDa subunit ARPC5 [Hesseltinella vesiculosa]|uniref:Actin-related protein 2/3 complex subunit 5 n=1 Tax=Hesseltinella vesiculosa TaxID=101127 RepID=A0A1X2GMB5_9FUNG|nr:Arp2/3 complex 16 kDa subunit ARPC5 [Hesseltinella vesiculosa]